MQNFNKGVYTNVFYRPKLNFKIGSSLISYHVSISIIDINGKAVFNQNYNNTRCKINVSNFNPGLYFIINFLLNHTLNVVSHLSKRHVN